VQAVNTYANNLSRTGRQSRAVYMVAFCNGKTNNTLARENFSQRCKKHQQRCSAS